MSKLEKAVDKIHKLRYSYAYKLRNIENEETMADYKDNASPWFENLRATAKWLKEKKKNVFDERELRLRISKWVFENHLMVEAKAVLDPEQPPKTGAGILPAWLRNKKVCLLCVFRCFAVHQGAHRWCNTRKTRELTESFFANHNIRNRKITNKALSGDTKLFQVGNCNV